MMFSGKTVTGVQGLFRKVIYNYMGCIILFLLYKITN